MDTIVVNLFGEPSVGKSTCAMDITAQLKRHGINAEYVSEFAKDKVYENNGEVFKHQEYLFGKYITLTKCWEKTLIRLY